MFSSSPPESTMQRPNGIGAFSHAQRTIYPDPQGDSPYREQQTERTQSQISPPYSRALQHTNPYPPALENSAGNVSSAMDSSLFSNAFRQDNPISPHAPVSPIRSSHNYVTGSNGAPFGTDPQKSQFEGKQRETSYNYAARGNERSLPYHHQNSSSINSASSSDGHTSSRARAFGSDVSGSHYGTGLPQYERHNQQYQQHATQRLPPAHQQHHNHSSTDTLQSPQQHRLPQQDRITDYLDGRTDNRREQQLAFKRDLDEQLRLKSERVAQEKQESKTRERKQVAQMSEYNPFGRGGGGAPLRSPSGQVLAELRHSIDTGHVSAIGSHLQGAQESETFGGTNSRRKSDNSHNNNESIGSGLNTSISPFGGHQQQTSIRSPISLGQQQEAGFESVTQLKRDPLNARLALQQSLKEQLDEQKRRKDEEKERIKTQDKADDERIARQRREMEESYAREHTKPPTKNIFTDRNENPKSSMNSPTRRTVLEDPQNNDSKAILRSQQHRAQHFDIEEDKQQSNTPPPKPHVGEAEPGRLDVGASVDSEYGRPKTAMITQLLKDQQTLRQQLSRQEDIMRSMRDQLSSMQSYGNSGGGGAHANPNGNLQQQGLQAKSTFVPAGGAPVNDILLNGGADNSGIRGSFATHGVGGSSPQLLCGMFGGGNEGAFGKDIGTGIGRDIVNVGAAGFATPYHQRNHLQPLEVGAETDQLDQLLRNFVARTHRPGM